jgi:isopropylmalate/homocitrate/citramalate synthase
MSHQIYLRDSTLRSGLDVPGVVFSVGQKLEILDRLDRLGVPEAELVAPSRVVEDLGFVKRVRGRELRLRTSGLIYASSPDVEAEMEAAAELLDRFDLLMPLSETRRPIGGSRKVSTLVEALDRGRDLIDSIGVGFPHATQASPLFLLEIAQMAIRAGARRITIYDTHGGSEPFALRFMLEQLVGEIRVPVFFHSQNDLGLALANSWAAVMAGASGLGVSSNGLGYRAGGACLEQVAVLLQRNRIETGVELTGLEDLARTVARSSGVPLSKLAPVVGDWAFHHTVPAHREHPDQFEAYPPGLVGASRRLVDD